MENEFYKKLDVESLIGSETDFLYALIGEEEQILLKKRTRKGLRFRTHLRRGSNKMTEGISFKQIGEPGFLRFEDTDLNDNEYRKNRFIQTGKILFEKKKKELQHLICENELIIQTTENSNDDQYSLICAILSLTGALFVNEMAAISAAILIYRHGIRLFYSTYQPVIIGEDWTKIKQSIIDSILSRELKHPNIPIRALTNIEKTLKIYLPKYLRDPINKFKVIDKDGFKRVYVTYKETKTLNTAESSIINEIYKRI